MCTAEMKGDKECVMIDGYPLSCLVGIATDKKNERAGESWDKLQRIAKGDKDLLREVLPDLVTSNNNSLSYGKLPFNFMPPPGTKSTMEQNPIPSPSLVK